MEQLLINLPTTSNASLESRVLAGRARNEDAAVVSFPTGKALVQSVDILAPIVNDAYMFGRIAAANALSDIYAMGAKPWCALNMLFFPTACNGAEGLSTMSEILRGGQDTLNEAECVLVGGHSVEDAEVKYGLSVTGYIDPTKATTNDGLKVGDVLILTKPLGTGILSTGIKARWDNWEQSQNLIETWCSKLNKQAAIIIDEFELKAATDITGFGLAGHSIEMALASKVQVEINSQDVPFFAPAIDYACNGLIPAGSHDNRKYWAKLTKPNPSLDQALESIIFDTQTSGGLLLAVPEYKADLAMSRLKELGEQGVVIGRVLPQSKEALVIL